MLMIGIWGEHAVDPEYENLRHKQGDLAGFQLGMKSEPWTAVSD